METRSSYGELIKGTGVSFGKGRKKNKSKIKSMKKVAKKVVAKKAVAKKVVAKKPVAKKKK